MVVATLAVLLQAPLSVEGVVDEMTARHGYGVIGISVGKMEPIVLPDPGNAVDVPVRLKNRWRVVVVPEMPGVFRAESVPYSEVFEETGQGVPYYYWQPGEKGAGPTLVRPGPKVDPLPKVERKDLSRPGGVRVSVERLTELLDPKHTFTVPWIYARRTARVRLDPDRAPEAISLIAAITGAKIVKGESVSAEHRDLAFEPDGFRRLAVATLRDEAKRGTRPLTGILPSKQREFARYESERPIWLGLGAVAHAAATDAELTQLYAAPGESKFIPGVTLDTELLSFARDRLKALRRTLEPTVAGEFNEISKVGVRLDNVRGTGKISVWSRNGASVLDLDDIDDSP